MTILSINANKIALLRNSRGRDYPGVLEFVEQVLAMGVKGITVHPRPDERHITRQDVRDISQFLKKHPQVEFNIEGYPTSEFLDLVVSVRPAQCTLVPDHPDQLTSDHGWDVTAHQALLKRVTDRLRQAGIRSSLFIDPSPQQVSLVPSVGANRIELYTENYAVNFGTARQDAVLAQYRSTADRAHALGIGINAGHDLNLQNLPAFLEIPRILEVSIGHALIVESLQFGLPAVVSRYLAITGG